MAGATPADGSDGAYIGVGCFTAFVGFFSGGMIGVLVGEDRRRGCAAAPPARACRVQLVRVRGGRACCVGAVTLPVLALWRLRRGERQARHELRRG